MKKWIVLTVLLATTLYGYSYVDGLMDRQNDQHVKEILEFQAKAAAAVAHADSMDAVIEARQQRMVMLESQVRDLRSKRPEKAAMDSAKSAIVAAMEAAEGDSVAMARTVIPAQQDLIGRQDSTIKVLDAVLVRQDTLLAQKDSSLADCRAASDSMRAVLMNPPKPPKPPVFLGLFPLPSRKTSALLGAAAGVFATWFLVR